MANENVGGIQYTVDAETSGLIKAESAAKKFTQNTAKSFGQAEAAAKNFDAQVTKSAASVKKGVQANLGQAGIQVQQFVGQLQGGQSAMVALAQQSADLGIVLGAPLIGVVVSLAAVLAGTLAPAVFGSVSNIEKLEKAIENTKAIMTLGKNGIIEYTDEMKRLETASENLAKIKIALAITQNTKALKESRKEFINLRADLFGFQEDSSEAAKRLTGLTDKTQDVLGLAQALQSFSNAVTDEDKLKQLSAAEEILLNMRNDKGEFPTKDLSEFAQEFFTLSDATRQAIMNNKALKGAVDELNTSAGDSEEKFKQLRVGLKEQTIALRDGERSAFKYALLMSGDYSAAQIEAALKIYDTNAALKAQKEEAEESAATLKKVNDELDAFFDNESRRSAEKDAQQTATLTRQVQNIGLTPEEEIQAQYERELELLRQAEEKKIEIEGTYAERRKQLEAERLESLRALHTENNQFLQDAFANLDTQIAGTMTQVVIGAKDGETAMRDLANTMLTQVIGAAVQYGIELVKNKVLGQALAASEQANIVATTTTGVAAQQTATASTTAAAATTATAAAPAAALTSTFSFGSAALIGGAALLGTLAISKMMASGAREFGGPVTAGKSYLVGERGPEMFTPNTSGSITSNKDMNGSGGGWTVNTYNYGPEKAYVTIDEVNKVVTTRIGAEAGKLSQGRGQFASAMKKGAGTQFNGAN